MLPAALSTYVAFEDARLLGDSLASAANRTAPAAAVADAATVGHAAAVAEASLRRSGFGHVAAAELAAGPAFGISGLTA